jgi:hypothetical protein
MPHLLLVVLRPRGVKRRPTTTPMSAGPEQALAHLTASQPTPRSWSFTGTQMPYGMRASAVQRFEPNALESDRWLPRRPSRRTSESTYTIANLTGFDHTCNSAGVARTAGIRSANLDAPPLPAKHNTPAWTVRTHGIGDPDVRHLCCRTRELSVASMPRWQGAPMRSLTGCPLEELLPDLCDIDRRSTQRLLEPSRIEQILQDLGNRP